MTNENVGSVILDGRWYGGGVGDADKTTYDNTESGLTATNVQSAIDSNASHIGGLGNVIGMRGWNQLIDPNKYFTSSYYGITRTKSGNALVFSGTATEGGTLRVLSEFNTIVTGHKYYIKSNYNKTSGDDAHIYINTSEDVSTAVDVTNDGIYTATNAWTTLFVQFIYTKSYNFSVAPNIIDLTALFGSGNEPTSVSEFRQMFGASYYPYYKKEVFLEKRIGTANINGTMSYTGLSITIPAKTYYSIIVRNGWDNAIPSEVALCRSTTELTDWYTASYSNKSSICMASGINIQVETWYIWAKTNGTSGSNYFYISGIFEEGVLQ